MDRTRNENIKIVWIYISMDLIRDVSLQLVYANRMGKWQISRYFIDDKIVWSQITMGLDI